MGFLFEKKKKKCFLKKVFSPKAINTSFGFNKVNGPFFKKGEGISFVCL